MLKSSPGYSVGWYMIKSTEKPCGLHRIWSRDHPTSYTGELFNCCLFLKYSFVGGFLIILLHNKETRDLAPCSDLPWCRDMFDLLRLWHLLKLTLERFSRIVFQIKIKLSKYIFSHFFQKFNRCIIYGLNAL